MQDNLQQLADKLGILTKFSDAGICKKDYYPPESVIRFFAESFGYKAGSDAEINASLEKIGRKRWQKALENIYVSLVSSGTYMIVSNNLEACNDCGLSRFIVIVFLSFDCLISLDL